MNSLTIVVADDDESLLTSLAQLLRLGGHTVHTAHDGIEALALCRAQTPDSVLLDIDMPGLTGWDVATALTVTDERCPARLVALSGRASAGDRERSRAAGFHAHCTKPAEPAELLRLLGA
ncbi:response regulator [Tahibacter sp.]|uniref:response regulator n=1 Tax=Tahibacter sp. TaxID=2056211 RepID=UPI0028C423E8|nr:response regulator [Tahibacter sp.]